MITRKTEYAIRALWELAHEPGDLTTVNQIASRQSIPAKYLPQIVAELTRAGLISSSRGFGGGLRLIKDPDSITILDIVQVIQGPIRLFECRSGQDDCVFLDHCDLMKTYRDGELALEALFGSRKLSDMNFFREETSD